VNKIQQQMGSVVVAADTASRSQKFAALYLEMWRRRDGQLPAHRVDKEIENILAQAPSTNRISLTGLKAAQSAQGTDNAAAFIAYQTIASGFVNSLVSADAFDRMLGAMRRMPLATGSVGAISTAATAYQINERDMKPLSRLSFTSQNADPLKAICCVILTQELLRFAPPGTELLIENELRQAVALTTDVIFFNTILSGITPFTSTGSTGESVRADISKLLETLTLGAESKLFLITTSLICKRFSMLTDQHGNSAFPELGPQGGIINKIPVVVSDGLASGLVVLADASGLGANPGELVLNQSSEGSYQMADVPDSPPTASSAFISMWQQNLTALRVERYFVAERLRANSVASISNSNSYSSGNSPP
jgi:HK97 family phage major capsid protein